MREGFDDLVVVSLEWRGRLVDSAHLVFQRLHFLVHTCDKLELPERAIGHRSPWLRAHHADQALCPASDFGFEQFPAVMDRLAGLLNWSNPPGQRLVGIALQPEHATLQVSGALLILLARVVAEAARLEEEHRGFF